MSRKRSHKRKKHPPAPRRRQKQPRRRTAPPRSRNERVLRERILKFTYQTRFGDDFKRAVRLYSGEEALQDNVLSLDERGMPGFQEWYINDYVTSEGERIIDLFAREAGPRLPAAQRQILDDWRRTNRYHLFEVQKVEPGVGETVRDLLSGEVLEVNDISTSYVLIKWQVVLARPLLTEGRLNFAGAVIPLPPMEKQALLNLGRELWEKYQTQHPQASLDDFYRDHSLDLYHHLIEIATAPPPPVYTQEGHPLTFSTARYAVKEPRTVAERLGQAEEFAYVGPADKDETALAYIWLLRGDSHVPEAPIEGRGMVMQTEWTAGSDGTDRPTYRSLGDVRLGGNYLELTCVSRERLAAGKMLLRRTLGRLVRHQSDEFKDMDAASLASARPPSPDYEEEIPTEIAETIVHERMVAQYAEWLDNPVPALDGKSPRQASRDPGMQEQLEELLKTVEYVEERKQRKGESCIDVADIRRKLGLPPR